MRKSRTIEEAIESLERNPVALSLLDDMSRLTPEGEGRVWGELDRLREREEREGKGDDKA